MLWTALLTVLDPGNPPAWCFRTNAEGELPTCTYVNGSWHRSYEDGGLGSGGDGIGGAMVALFVIGLVVSGLVLAWKISTARKMARAAGMNEDDATIMTVLTDDGFEATYLAANLRQPPAQPGAQPPTQPPTPAVPPAGERLRELDRLLEEGLITQAERDERRRAVIDGI
ncbi:MAG: hypothetical protein HYU55_10060 [Nocardioides sp.]|nr:hypothetical protein [Nocardioides sp.]